MKNIFFKTILFLICFVVVASCGPKVIRLNNTVYPPTKEIEIITEYPTNKQFEKIAILTITDEDYFTTDQMMTDLKKKAMELGANAIVIENVNQGQSGLIGGYTPIGSSGLFYAASEDNVAVKAMAIRYISNNQR